MPNGTAVASLTNPLERFGLADGGRRMSFGEIIRAAEAARQLARIKEANAHPAVAENASLMAIQPGQLVAILAEKKKNPQIIYAYRAAIPLTGKIVHRKLALKMPGEIFVETLPKQENLSVASVRTEIVREPTVRQIPRERIVSAKSGKVVRPKIEVTKNGKTELSPTYASLPYGAVFRHMTEDMRKSQIDKLFSGGLSRGAVTLLINYDGWNQRLITKIESAVDRKRAYVYQDRRCDYDESKKQYLYVLGGVFARQMFELALGDRSVSFGLIGFYLSSEMDERYFDHTIRMALKELFLGIS